jgi:mono/diheme cytochrome c family protein
VRFWAIALLAIAAYSIPAFPSSASRRAHGAQVFAASGCQHCHMIGTVGGHRGPDLSGVGRKCSKAQMRRQIVKGSIIMPAFGDVLQPSELKDLIDYLHSCRTKNKESSIRSDPPRVEFTQ